MVYCPFIYACHRPLPITSLSDVLLSWRKKSQITLAMELDKW